MSPPGHGSDDSSFAQDVGTQTAKAVALIVVAVLIAVLVLHHEGSSGGVSSALSRPPATTPKAATSTPTTTAPATPSIPPSQVKLLVLNGTTDTGGTVAGQYSAMLKRSPGYDTLTPDNATAPVPASIIYATTSTYLPEAQALAQTLGLPTAHATDNVPPGAPIKSTERSAAEVILVVGPDLADKLPGATTSTTT